MLIIGQISLVHQWATNKITWIMVFSSICSCSVKNISVKERLPYDELTKKYVYIGVEKMPVYKNGEKDFLDDFIKYFHYKYQIDEDIQTKLRIQFVIDAKGHLIGARIYDKKPETLTNFEKAGLKAIVLLQSWKAGRHNGKNVNVMLTRVINVDYNNR